MLLDSTTTLMPFELAGTSSGHLHRLSVRTAVLRRALGGIDPALSASTATSSAGAASTRNQAPDRDDLIRVAEPAPSETARSPKPASWSTTSATSKLRCVAALNGGGVQRAITEPTFNTDGRRGTGGDLSPETCSFPISPDRQDTQIFVETQAALAYAGIWSTTFDDQAPEGTGTG